MKKDIMPDLPVKVVYDEGRPSYALLPWPFFQWLLALARKGAQDKPTVTRAAGVFRSEPLEYLHTKKFFISSSKAQSAKDLIKALLGDFEAGMIAPMDDDEADAAALVEARERNDEAFPLELVERLHEGVNPIKVYRKHRGLTQAALAERVGLSAMYLSQIETGRRQGSTKALRKIARALAVDLDDLTPWGQE